MLLLLKWKLRYWKQHSISLMNILQLRHEVFFAWKWHVNRTIRYLYNVPVNDFVNLANLLRLKGYP